MDSFKRPFTFDRVVRLLIGLGVAVILFFLVRRLSYVLLPFLLAWLLSYIFYPVVCFFQYRCRLKNRIAAISVTLLLLLSAVSLVLYLSVPPIVHEIGRTVTLLSQSMSAIESLSFLPEDLRVYLIEWRDNFHLEQLFTANYLKEIETMVPHVFTFLSSSFNFLVSLFVVFVILLYLIFILLDYEHLANSWQSLIPHKYQEVVLHIFGDLKLVMNRYFRGQALIALISGVLLAAGFSLIGLPLGMTLGLLMGVLTLVPYLKMIMLPALAFFALLKAMETGMPFWIPALSVLAILTVVQVLEDLVLVPKIMGKAMSLNPAIILLSLSIWGALLGVIGMIVALPVTTILLSYYRRIVVEDKELFTAEDIIAS